MVVKCPVGICPGLLSYQMYVCFPEWWGREGFQRLEWIRECIYGRCFFSLKQSAAVFFLNIFIMVFIILRTIALWRQLTLENLALNSDLKTNQNWLRMLTKILYKINNTNFRNQGVRHIGPTNAPYNGIFCMQNLPILSDTAAQPSRSARLPAAIDIR